MTLTAWRRVFVFLFSLLAASAAHAQLFRTYLASDGNDANPCTLPQPCRLLPAALAAVADGGEIWMLDSANYNTSQVNVTKSVSILAIPGALGSVVATGGNSGIVVNGAGVVVALRNLVVAQLAGFSSQHGIHFAQGAELLVADCEVANTQQDGIRATSAGGKLTVKSTVVRNTGIRGIYAGTGVTASVSDVNVKATALGIFADSGSRLAVSNAVVSGTTTAVGGFAAASALTQLVVEGSMLTGNLNGIYVQTGGDSATTDVSATRNVVSQNNTGFFINQAGVGASATAVVDSNTVTHNSAGFNFAFGVGTVFTRGNNTVKYNTNDVVGGALTAIGGM